MPTSFYIFARVFLVGLLEVGLLGQWVNVHAIYLDITQIPLLGDCTIFHSLQKWNVFPIAPPQGMLLIVEILSMYLRHLLLFFCE